jgi:hypothetical protein
MNKAVIFVSLNTIFTDENEAIETSVERKL